MITKNLKNLANSMLQATPNSNVRGLLPVRAVDGNTFHVASYFNSYPRAVTETFTLSATAAGISVGSGNTPATDEDYQLESTITSGLTAQVNRILDFDGSGYPYIRYDIMLTNNTGNDIVVNEIGYKQNIQTATSSGGASVAARLCLIDRTVLNSPLVIEAGTYEVIRYTLKTIVPEEDIPVIEEPA